jgi:hypothetical protein
MCFEKILTTLVFSLDDWSNSADAMASISTRRALNSASKSPFEPLRRSAKSLSAAVLIWHCTICCPFLIVNLNAIRSASYPMAFPVLSGMNPVPFPTTREADHAVGCQVSIYRARQLTFWKQRSKACPQRFASSRPAGICGDPTEIDPVLVLQCSTPSEVVAMGNVGFALARSRNITKSDRWGGETGGR